MEIEHKYLVDPEKIPFSLDEYPHIHIEQGYLCTDPAIRVRMEDKAFFMTYKSKGFLSREEVNLPLTREAYDHLLPKTDGHLIVKDRYVIPLEGGLKLELDFFDRNLKGLVLAEIEFPDEDSASSFTPLPWFGEDVTYSSEYQNATLSQRSVF